MKQVIIRRHAPKEATGELTEDGKENARKLAVSLEKFDLVISSDKPRAVETAFLLTGVQPMVDKRAGTPKFTLKQEEELHIKGKNHPFGIAGVILDTPEYRPMIEEKGMSLLDLVRDIMEKLPQEGKALIISHDGVMTAAERLLRKLSLDKADKGYKPLHGFVVYEDGTFEDLK